MRRRASVHSSRPARPKTVTGTTKTPEGTTRSGLRVHQCKHRLLRNLGRLAPPGKTYCTLPSHAADTGLSTSFDDRRPNRQALSTFRQHSDPGRSRGGAWSGAGRPRSAHGRVGPTKTPEGTSGSAPSPQMQAPAASRLRSVGPSGQDLLYPVGAALDQRLIHEFQSSLVHPKHVVHAHSTGLCPNTPVPWSPRRPRISRLQAPTERRQSAGRPGRSRARPLGPEPRHCRRGRRASRTRSGVEIVGARQSPQDSR
jgi:hypothetical protein